MKYTQEKIQHIAQEAIDALCLSVQKAVGQTDGGFAALYFSGRDFEQFIEAYVRGEINFVAAEKEKA